MKTWGESTFYNDDLSQILYFEAGRCGIHPYRKDIRIIIDLSLLAYACQVWHTGLTVSNSDKLGGIQKRAMKIAFPELSYECALTINTLHTRREELCRRFSRGICRPHHILPPPRLICFRLFYCQSTRSFFLQQITKHIKWL